MKVAPRDSHGNTLHRNDNICGFSTMRVLHIITRMVVGGAQENTLLCCRDLTERFGDQVLLATGPALGPEGNLLSVDGAGAVPTVIIPSLRRAILPWMDVIAYRAIRKLIREFRPDVVHTHSAKAGILGRAAGWALGVPAVIHTVHGAPFHPYQSFPARWFFRQCERWAARRCHHLISVADAMTNLLVEASVAPREKFTTVYSGIDIAVFPVAESGRATVRQQLGFTPADIVIAAVGRLAPLKGYEFLLSAVAAAVEQRPQLRLMIVGDGPLRHRLERQAQVRRIFCTWLGLVSPQQVPALLAAADLVVHASLREGLARVLPQAILVGRKAVSFDIDGAREVIRPGETGYLVPPGDVGELTRSIIGLTDEIVARGTSSLVSAEARKAIARQFDYRRATSAIRDLYQRVLDSQR